MIPYKYITRSWTSSLMIRFPICSFCFRKENVNSNKVCSPSDKKMPLPATRKAQFSLEDICMYLYGHTPVEPAVLEDQLKLVKQEESCQGNADVNALLNCHVFNRP